MRKPDKDVADKKDLIWLGSTRADLGECPEDVQDVVGYALHLAEIGEKHPDAKPLKGFKGAGVLEIIDDYRTDTYRAVYTVRFAGAIYVLHVFQKKSKKGIETPKPDMDVIKHRLKIAEQHWEANYLHKARVAWLQEEGDISDEEKKQKRSRRK
jgi:phage-related protein